MNRQVSFLPTPIARVHVHMHPGYSRDVSAGSGTPRKLKNDAKKTVYGRMGLDFWGFVVSEPIDGFTGFQGWMLVVFIRSMHCELSGFLLHDSMINRMKFFGNLYKFQCFIY